MLKNLFPVVVVDHKITNSNEIPKKKKTKEKLN
jgi:hypothetical protein